MSSTLTDPWQLACERYLEGLTDEERNLFLAATPENLFYGTSAAQILHSERSKSRAIVAKLQPLVAAIEQYGNALDVISNASANILCPLWGCVRVLLLIASAYDKYFEKLVDMLSRIGDVLPRFHAYGRLFRTHEHVRHALSMVYLDIITFCSDAKRVFQEARKQRVMSLKPFKILWKPFDRQFGDVVQSFRNHRDNLEKETALAHMIEEADERIEQGYERTIARMGREAEEAAKQAMKRTSMLRQLSSIEHNHRLRQLRKKRYNNTGSWVAGTDQFYQWVQTNKHSCLWCYGIPGCGKTVLATAMIDTLVASSTSMESVTVHFFCDYADQKTLCAVEIFGSLAKQLLSAFKRIPEEMEKMIRNAYGDGTLIPDASTVLEILLAAVKLFSRVYIVLDGVDECRGEDRLEVIAAIRTMSSADPEKSALRLFISSRGDVDIERALEYSIHLQVNAENISPDIKSFIAGIIKDKEYSGDLSVRDPGLLNEIIAVLADKADGMFLWVAFQVADICNESTTDGIRAALQNLPKDLPETYQRALEKVHKGVSSDALIAKKTFKWIICAKRPLFMDELKEAVAVEPGDKDLNHNRIPSNDSRIIRACANLVVFDKDDRKVSLAHHTVKEFLLGLWPNATPTLPTFCFDLSKANRELAGVCLTYFHFNAFETQLTHTVDVPAPNMNELVPGIMREVLSPSMFGKGLLSGWSRIQGLRNNFQQSIVSLGRYGRNIHRRKLNLNPEHRLLQYVIEYWLFHTADLTRNDSDLWDLFQNLVLDKRIPFDFRPWKEVSPDREFPYLPILYWAIEEGNVALLNVLMPKGSMPPRYCNRIVSESVAKASTLSSALGKALKRGHLHIWEILLFQVPELQWSQFSERLHGLSASEKNKVVLLAVEGGYLEVTKCLVLNGVADVEWGTADRWLTLVEIALARGHTDIAHLLQLKAPHSLLHLF